MELQGLHLPLTLNCPAVSIPALFLFLAEFSSSTLCFLNPDCETQDTTGLLLIIVLRVSIARASVVTSAGVCTLHHIFQNSLTLYKCNKL